MKKSSKYSKNQPLTGCRFIGYARVSTDNQADAGTIEIQMKALQDYATANGFELVKIFTDNGVSGSKELENRPGLSDMFSFLENEGNDINGVVVWKLDRLARDLYISEYLFRKISDLDKFLISVKEGTDFNSDPMRVAFRQFMGIVSELEKSFIVMRMSEGRNNKARKTGYGGGRAALGYKTNDKQLTIDGSQAETVKLIYSLKAEGMTLRAIANELNERGLKSADGGAWIHTSIAYILKNKKYSGVMQYNDIIVERNDLAIMVN